MGGGGAPESPDPAKVIPLQTAANKQAFDYVTQQSRVNTVTPYGTSNWTRTPTFDEAGYNAALDSWKQKNPQGVWVPEQIQHTGSGGIDDPVRSVTVPGYWQGQASDGNAAPTRDAFTSYSWENKQEFSPAQQALFDQNQQNALAMSAALPDLRDRAGEASRWRPDMVTPDKALTVDPSDYAYQDKLTRHYLVNGVGYGDINRGDLSSINPEAFNKTSGPASMIGDRSGDIRDWAARLMPEFQGEIDQLKSLRDRGSAFNNEGADAAYRVATRYMDPQQQQEKKAMEARLGEQGFVPGTPAYDQAMRNFQETSDRAYADARDKALLTGHEWGQDEYNQRSGTTKDILASMLSGGTFGLNSDLTRANFGLQNDQARSNEALSRAQFASEQERLASQNSLDIAKFLTGRQAQDFDQQKALSEQVRQSGLDANNVVMQQFGLDKGRSEFNNAAKNADVKNLETIHRYNLDATNSNNASQLAATTANNSANASSNQTAIANLLTALGASKPGQLPGSNIASGGGNMNPADIMGAFNQQYQGQLNGYNAGVAADNANMQAASQIAGMLAMFAMGASDRRVKENIIPMGKTPGGHNWYAFNYIGNPAQQYGVMAQEVRETLPEAVHEIDGVLHVDYLKVH